MFKVEIQNFQSISREVVELDHFTVVVGDSNLGKSAIIRAIKAAITGATADDYVRHSQDCPRFIKGAKSCKCYCSVHITGDGLDLLWEKGDSVNRYVYNSVEYTAVGRGTPAFLGASFEPIKVGDEKVLLQVADQFNPIFLLNKSGTAAADILSDVAKLDEINVAIRLVDKDRREAVSIRKVRSQDVRDLEGKLASFDGLDAALLALNLVSEAEESIKQLTAKEQQLQSFIERLVSTSREVKRLTVGLQFDIPNPAGFQFLLGTYTKLSALIARHATVSVSVQRLSGITALDVGTLSQVQELRDRYTQVKEWASRMTARERDVGRLASIDSVSVPIMPVVLSTGIQRMASLESWHKKMVVLKRNFTAHKALTAATLPTTNLQAKADRYRNVARWATRIQTLREGLAQSEAKLQALQEQEAEVLAEFAELGVCPTCRQDLQSTHTREASCPI